jgi:hypothetical protein
VKAPKAARCGCRYPNPPPLAGIVAMSDAWVGRLWYIFHRTALMLTHNVVRRIFEFRNLAKKSKKILVSQSSHRHRLSIINLHVSINHLCS